MIDLTKLKGNFLQERSIRKNYPDEYRKIMEFTSTLDVSFPKRLWHYQHRTLESPKCATCKGDFSEKERYSKFCSKKCSLDNPELKEKMKKSRVETSIKKYGTSHPMKLESNKEKVSSAKKSYDLCKKKLIREKTARTNIEKYGVQNPSQNTTIQKKRIESFKKNIQQWKASYEKTSKERYGTSHPWSNSLIREKYISSMLRIYGADNPMKSEELKRKIQETNLKRFGHNTPFASPEIRGAMYEKYDGNPWKDNVVIDRIKKTKSEKYLHNLKVKIPGFLSFNQDEFSIHCKDCDSAYTISRSVYFKRIKYKVQPCTKCNKIYSRGEKQKALQEWISSLGIVSRPNDRSVLNGKELDVYIPQKKVAIEFNGLYWHSELHRDKWYHLEKTDLCEILGIQLLQIYEDDWDLKEDIVKSRIKNILGMSSQKIYARKCEIREIEYARSEKFLLENHIQGSVRSKINLGLFYGEELLSLMTFGSLRAPLGQRSESGSYEMLRFCVRKDTNVIGGAGKLFSYFLQKYQPNSIISYADRSWSMGDLYRKLGFELIDMGSPNYWYIVDGVRSHRYNFRKDLLVKQGYDPSMTEKEIMIERGFLRIYDSGSLKFLWKKEYIEKQAILDE